MKALCKDNLKGQRAILATRSGDAVRALAGTVRDGGPPQWWPRNDRQGTVESAPRGDRATAPIEDIWCEKIRGCSCGESNTPTWTRFLINRDLRRILLNVRHAQRGFRLATEG